MNYKFTPDIRTIGHIDQRFEHGTIKNEPMLYGADINFAFEHGGPIVKEVLGKLLQNKTINIINGIIDVRVNMLKPGWYPSIPGWHCDDVPRNNNLKQPDLNLVSENVKHYLVILSDSPTPVSSTEFITDEISVNINNTNVWQSLNDALKEREFRTGKLQEGDIIEFSQRAIHRATPCANPGWRFFFRISVNSPREFKNEIRNQTQTYVISPDMGW